MQVKKIAIDGPESTGKSALAQQLALHYNAAWVPEAARDYLNSLGRNYVEEDLLQIAILQCKSEDDAAAKHSTIFCDTTLLVIKIWSEYKYGRCHPFIINEFENRKYDLYLLTGTDLPWEDDPLREHPEERDELFNRYHHELIVNRLNYEIVTGLDELRLQNAVHYCNAHISI